MYLSGRQRYARTFQDHAESTSCNIKSGADGWHGTLARIDLQHLQDRKARAEVTRDGGVRHRMSVSTRGGGDLPPGGRIYFPEPVRRRGDLTLQAEGRICLPDPPICLPEPKSATQTLITNPTTRAYDPFPTARTRTLRPANRKQNLPPRASNLFPRARIYHPDPQICIKRNNSLGWGENPKKEQRRPKTGKFRKT